MNRRMGRVRKKHVKNPTNISQSNFDDQENDDQRNQALSFRCRHAEKSTTGKCSTKCQSTHQLEKAVVILKDIAINSPFVIKRTVLSDKTNRSPMSRSNQRQKDFNESTSQDSQEKMSHNLSGRNSKERSSYKLSDSRKQLFVNKYPLGVVSCDKNDINWTKSSHLSDKCIYTKVQRETLINKNMPVEEKLAQYEFEVDENEPVVKKRKKTKVKNKKKGKSKEVYCPPSKVFQKIFQAGVEEAEEKIKTKSKDDANLNKIIDFTYEDNCREPTLGYEGQEDAVSPLVTPSNVKARSFSENSSPVARPYCQIQKRSVKSGNIIDLEVNTKENDFIHIMSLSETSIPNSNLEVSVAFTSKEVPTAESRSNNKSGLFKSPNQINIQMVSSLANTISTPVQSNVKVPRFSLPEVTSTSTPVFQSTPLNVNYQATRNVSHSTDVCSANYSVNRNKRVSIVPRESGGINNASRNALTENWSVDNCFGFDDSDEPAELSFKDISLKERSGNNTQAIKSPPFSNKRKPQHLKGKENKISSLNKGTALVSPNKSLKLGISDTNISEMNKLNASINTLTEEHSGRKLDTPVIEKPSSAEAFDLLPYSNPMKQSKLDFLGTGSNTSTSETPKKINQESPLLFKDPEDKTPIHFKEPARRSYVRSARRKLKPVGSEWIHSESEEEGEHSHHPPERKRKRGKLNKHEEKEANQWMKDFNRQCEEIEGFELCVEK